MNKVISITILDKDYEEIVELNDKCYEIYIPVIDNLKSENTTYNDYNNNFELFFKEEPVVIKWLYDTINSTFPFNIKVLIESNGEQYAWRLDSCSIVSFEVGTYVKKTKSDSEDFLISCVLMCKGVYFEQNGKRLFAQD